jgi:ketosteroid isomerase-like protein
MAGDHKEAQRQAAAWIDAVNRRDLDAVAAMVHEDMTVQGGNTDRHLGREEGRIEGKQAYREFLRWLFAQEPPVRHVLEDVFTGPQGNAFLTHAEPDGTRFLIVREVDTDGLVRNAQVYLGRPAAG